MTVGHDAPEGRETTHQRDPSDRLLSFGRRQLGLDVGVQIAGRLANVLVSVVVTGLLVRALGDEEFGRWATILAIIQILGYVADLGAQQVAVRYAVREPRMEPELIGALLGVRGVLGPTLFVVGALTASLVSDTSEMRRAAVVLSGVLVASIPGVVSALFQIRVKNHLSVLASTVNTALWTAAVVSLSTLDAGLVAFAWAYTATAAVTALVQLGMALRLSPIRFPVSTRLPRQILAEALPLGVSSILAVTYARLDQVLVFQLAGARDASSYGAVFRILDQAQVVPLSLMTTAFPLLSASVSAPVRLQRIFAMTFRSLTIPAAGALAFALVAAEPTVVLIFGPPFRDAAPALPILMGTFAFVSVVYLNAYTLTAMGRQRRLLRYTATGLVLNVVLNLAFVPEFGFIAAAAITLVTQAVVAALSYRDLRQQGLRLGFAGLVRVALAAAGMALCVLVARAAGAPALALVLIAGPSYLGLVLLLRAVPLDDLKGAMRR